MRTLTQPELGWELHRAGIKVAVVAQRVGKHRATIYRWPKGIRLGGLREFIEDYKNAKKGPRRRRVNPHVEQRVLSIRRKYHDCCGEKIVYWLKKEGIHLSHSTVYRILNKHLQLRPKGRRNRKRGPVPRAEAPRQVIQMDTVDFGEIYAYTAVDIYTQEAQVVLLPGLTSRDGRKPLELVMAYFGSCEVLQTDGGKEFGGEFEEKVGCYAQRHRMAKPNRRNEQAFVESFHRTLRNERLGWCKHKLSEREELQRRPTNTWTTITMSGLTWASTCEPLYHLFLTFDMRDTDLLTKGVAHDMI